MENEEKKITPQQRYRKTDKCKVARAKYYETKGKTKAHDYYIANREKILNRSKERYNNLRNNLKEISIENVTPQE